VIGNLKKRGGIAGGGDRRTKETPQIPKKGKTGGRGTRVKMRKKPARSHVAHGRRGKKRQDSVKGKGKSISKRNSARTKEVSCARSVSGVGRKERWRGEQGGQKEQGGNESKATGERRAGGQGS